MHLHHDPAPEPARLPLTKLLVYPDHRLTHPPHRRPLDEVVERHSRGDVPPRGPRALQWVSLLRIHVLVRDGTDEPVPPSVPDGVLIQLLELTEPRLDPP